MKIALGSIEQTMFAKHFVLEGEEITGPDDIPDVVLSSNILEFNEYAEKKIMGRACVTSEDMLQDLFPFPWNNKEISAPDGFLTLRYFDGEEWRPQTLIGIELTRLLAGDLGPEEHMGMALRPVTETRCNEVYDNEEFIKFLQLCDYKGFVTVRFNLPADIGDTISIRGIEMSAPPNTLVHIIEGCKERTMDYFMDERAMLFQSWTASLVMFRWPYPREIESSVPVYGLTNDVLRHFWPIDIDMYRKAKNTNGGVLGVSSAWNEDLYRCCKRALHTLMNISVEGKFYRTDLLWKASWIVRGLEEIGVI